MTSMAPRSRSGGARRREQSIGDAARHEHISRAPHRLDETGLARIDFEQLAQAPDRHVEAAVPECRMAAAELIVEKCARQRFQVVIDELLEDRELALAQRNTLAVAA